MLCYYNYRNKKTTAQKRRIDMTVHELLEMTTEENLKKLEAGKKFNIEVYEELKKLEKNLIIAGVNETNTATKVFLEKRELDIRALLFTYTRYRD